MTDERYFQQLEAELDRATAVAERARRQGRDPRPEVEIPTARDMADRVEKVLGIEGVAERVRELEGEYSREEAALELVGDFVDGDVGDFDDRAGKIEGAVRTAVALLTEGVVAAPIEGIDRVELLENDDGTEFVNVYYAGPIRSAGGTAQALSVLVADYARSLLGIDEYRAREAEIGRYAEEVQLYDDETGLQYCPGDREAEFIAQHMPVMLDGEATGDGEVAGYRDLERVDTNNPRGGMCLVLGEGIALKAPKIQRYTRELEAVDWPWLQDLIDGTIGEGDADDGDDGGDDGDGEDGDDGEGDGTEGPPRAEPHSKYLRDLIAGRPVFGHPSEPGGFRLRYGRARNHGHATAGVHPATMHLLGDFLAPGTQLKTERPGKAAGVVPVDTIEGPTVRLANGDVRRIDDAAEAREVRNGVEAILDLGEYLVNYGEFVENNHPLSPAGYAVEWWRREFERTEADVRALADDPHVDLDHPGPDRALRWAREYDAPLHPEYTYLWHDLPSDRFERLARAVADGRIEDGDLVLTGDSEVCRALEVLLVEHRQGDHVRIGTWRPLALSLGVAVRDGGPDLERTWESLPDDAADRPTSVPAVRAVAPFDVRERAPTRVGCRMGRPEKSERRELSPAVHALYPIGEAGGSQRDVSAAADYTRERGAQRGRVEVEVSRRVCRDCGTETHESRCDCGGHTDPYFECPDCGQRVEADGTETVRCPRCDVEASAVQRRELDVRERFQEALDRVGERESAFDVLKGVKGLTSTTKTPEPVEKGVLRAKHDVSAFKDGTVRYDMTDLPVTAVRPDELDVSPGRMRELGYETDVRGDPLRHGDQLVELNVQDIVLSDGAADYMLDTADFVDDLLESFYGLAPYYEFDDREDLVGELVFGMAPHTSAAVVGRVVGFTSAAVGYAHPYFHAAKRRNCFHPDTKVWYENEAGRTRHERIADLVADRLDDPEHDDFGAAVERLDGDLSVPSIDEDGRLVSRPVTAVSRHPAQDHVVAVTTESGREMTVTPDHELQVYDPETGAVRAREARNLTETDLLLTPDHLRPTGAGDGFSPIGEASADSNDDNSDGDDGSGADEDGGESTIDVLAALLRTGAVDPSRLTVRGLDREWLYALFERHLSGDDGQFRPLADTADYLDVSQTALDNYCRRESVPVDLLLSVAGREQLLAALPAEVGLGVKRNDTQIDRIVPVNERVATLLGYYVAEGFTRNEGAGGVHQTTICVTEAESRSFVLSTLRDEFGVAPYEESDTKVTASGPLLQTLFDEVFEAGAGADEKRVPQLLFDAPDDVVGAFLGGYVSGDGSVDAEGLRITMTTVSRELKEDLLALCSRLGVEASARRADPVTLDEPFPESYEDDTDRTSAPTYTVSVSSDAAVEFARAVPIHLSRKQRRLQANVETVTPRGTRAPDEGTADATVDPVESVTIERSQTDWTYSLTVADTHSLVANDLATEQCDGDEDCVMLLLDGLLNFSRQYLPDQRGGRMDAPLVMSSRIDPSEIDDEAHNVDVDPEYPLELYERSRELAHPEDVDVTIGEDLLETENPTSGFAHTHETTDIAAGPDLSAYKTLEDMSDKMDGQLELARTIRAVDETDVAERIIEYHFLPDLIGNLRAFASQEVRCLDCNTSYRRPPLSGDCRSCGGDVTLTVHEGSVTKYLETATRIAEEYGARTYTKQRLEVLERSIERIFEDDTNKQSGIADFM